MKESYARAILSEFPYPVAKQFIKLRTDECLDPGPFRLKYILATGEALSRLLGVVVLCECREFLETRQVPLSKALAVDFGRTFKRPSWGFWTFVTREGLKLLMAHEASLVLPELPGFYFSEEGARGTRETEAAQALSRLLTIRNGLSHDRIKAMRTSEFRALCEETYPLLCAALERAEFLLGYELTFFSRIEVDKRRRQPPDYIHRYKRMSGISDDFLGGKEHFSETRESRAIVLAGIDDRRTRSLSLDPMYVYEEDAGEAPDIYYYNGMSRPEVAEYTPCNRRGSFQANESHRGDVIADELAHLLDLFAGTSEPTPAPSSTAPAAPGFSTPSAPRSTPAQSAPEKAP